MRILILSLFICTNAAWGQCGRMVVNPSTGRLDCIGKTADGVGGASTLTGSNALLKDAAAGTAGLSAVIDDGTNILTTAARNYGFGIFARTGNTAPGTNKVVWWNKDGILWNTATLGAESLTNGALTTPGAEWAVTGHFTLAGNVAAFSGTAGTLSQPAASQVFNPGASAHWYKLVYTVAVTTAVAPACSVTSAFGDATFGLAMDITAGAAKVLYFKSAAPPGAFTLTCTATSGAFLLDDLSLKEVQGGDLSLGGLLSARGATFYPGTTATSVPLTIRGGLGQSANLTNWTNSAGTTLAYIGSTGFFNGPSTFTTYKYISSSAGFLFYYNGSAYDVSLARTSAGRLQVAGGATDKGKWGSLDASNLYANALATPTITSVTPSANNGVTCTYVLVGYDATGAASTAASAAVSTGAAGPTNCNSNTSVWTAASNVTSYQLSRTAGGATQGLITAMAPGTWLNNTTNCPAGTCTYIDTGSAASGTAPAANTTGVVIPKIATPAAATDACTPGAIWPDASYIYSCTSSGAIKRGAIAAW